MGFFVHRIKAVSGKLGGWLACGVDWMITTGVMIAGFLSLAMVALTTCDVVLRYIFNSPLEWGLEVQEFFLVGIVYLGLGYTEQQDGHVRVEMVFSLLPEKTKRVLMITTRSIMLGFLVLLTCKGTAVALHAFEVYEVSLSAARLPLFPSMLTIPIGSGLMSFVLIVKICKDMREAFG
ncbi:MAG: TRAP transporter small permease subunit [Candidatus Hodarchaeota archaeon]